MCIRDSTYGLPEMARMLGVHRQTIYYIVANEDFELIKVGRYKRCLLYTSNTPNNFIPLFVRALKL